MNRQLSKLWLVVVFAAVALAGCSKDDRTEPNSPAEQTGEAVTLRLSAEIGFEEENDFRGLSFGLEDKDGDGLKIIPRPQLTEGQEVDVVTVIKSRPSSGSGVTYAQKMKWKYSAATKRLVLSRTSANNGITIPSFNNDNGVKWYIAGLLVPTGQCILSGTNSSTVSLTPTRALKGVNFAQGFKDLGEMNIPYWTGWMELLIESFPPNTKDGNGSYGYAKVQTTGHKFKPLGSLIAYKLGNKLTAGNYTFTPTGFTVNSNAYADTGKFEFAATSLTDDSPKWTATSASMAYTFASGYTAPPISHNVAGDNSGRAYYAWVMPSITPPATVQTRVMLYGTSSNFTSTSNKRYLSDYTSSGKSPQSSKIHTLTANATRRFILPIEYVTEYNLAGGESLTYTSTNFGPTNQPAGVLGPLRFSNRTVSNAVNPDPHRNDQSGYYNWYKVVGVAESTRNNFSPAKNLATEQLLDHDGTTIRLDSKYFIPEQDHWWGIFPGNTYSYWIISNVHILTEYFQLGYAANESDRQLFWGSCQYSAGAPDPNEPDNAVVYAIRFAAAGSTSPQAKSDFYNLAATSSALLPSRAYQPLTDNRLRCAYRYTRVGSKTAWTTSFNNLTNQVKIDVVYLGDDPSVTTVDDISDPSWWSSPDCTRYFPATGYIHPNSATSSYLTERGYLTSHWSASASSGGNSWCVYSNAWDTFSNRALTRQHGFPVRLFRREP